MVGIKVCVGGSCHVRGSFLVVQRLKELVLRHGLTGFVSIQAATCMGNCENGVCVTVGDKAFAGVTPESIGQLFLEEILPAAV